MALVDTRLRRVTLAALLAVLPRVTSPFVLELVTQTALAAVGALALNLLTGLAGQISLGHAGFLAAGAFTTAMLVEAGWRSPLATIPAAALVGAGLGVAVGIPSLRLKGLYLALGTLAMHYVVLYVAGEIQTRWGSNTGYTIPPPRLFGLMLKGGASWFSAWGLYAPRVFALAVIQGPARAGRA